MVFLAITPNGLSEALRLAAGSPVWCGADAIAEQEFTELRGRNVTRFIYSLMDQGPQVLADAVATIREHHPAERLWVESGFCSSTER
jgi:hypothetical protein